MVRLFATPEALVAEKAGAFLRLRTQTGLDALFDADDPVALVGQWLADADAIPGPAPTTLRAPIQNQEIWAAGVTYLRSMRARMQEAKDAGGGDFYDRVYAAERPELFFKGTPNRVAAPGTPVHIRADSKWNVPEPELTLAINRHGRIFGYTVGNDMSSRDIEGQNPLYLPQAKTYDRSAALGPCLVVTNELPGPDTHIVLEIRRAGAAVFNGETQVKNIKRPLPSLAEWLFRENTFLHGAYLMTGTGIVPADTFTLQAGDEIRITIDGIGTLINPVD